MDDFKLVFGKKLKELRKAHKLRLKDLAEKLDVSFVAISQYENALNYPSFMHILKISQFFDVSVDYLLGINATNIDKVNKEYEATFYLAKKQKISPETLNEIINAISKSQCPPDSQ